MSWESQVEEWRAHNQLQAVDHLPEVTERELHQEAEHEVEKDDTLHALLSSVHIPLELLCLLVHRHLSRDGLPEHSFVRIAREVDR